MKINCLSREVRGNIRLRIFTMSNKSYPSYGITSNVFGYNIDFLLKGVTWQPEVSSSGAMLKGQLPESWH